MTLEDDDVLVQLLAGALEADELLPKITLGFLGGAPGTLLGFGDHRPGLGLGVGQRLTSLLLRLLHGHVRRPLGEHQRPPQRIVVVRQIGGPLLGPHRPLHGLPQAVVQQLDTRRRPLEELVDVVLVVAPQFLTELDLS